MHIYVIVSVCKLLTTASVELTLNGDEKSNVVVFEFEFNDWRTMVRVCPICTFIRLSTKFIFEESELTLK